MRALRARGGVRLLAVEVTDPAGGLAARRPDAEA